MHMTIDQTLDKIYSYVDYSLTHVDNVPAGAFSLEKISRLMSALGDPQKSYPVIHIAGTKGKGSVSAMLAAALNRAGLRTGLYTSPHLIRFNERIMVDGKMISDDDLIRLTEEITELVDLCAPVSTFELITAMAFQYFREQHVDIAIIETGLGGRLDATNVVDPLLTVITSISLDHMSFLGNTIEAIAGEKAGIIKHGVPVICASQIKEAESVIRRVAAERTCPWIYVPERYRYINVEDSEEGQKIMIWRPEDQQLVDEFLGCDGQSSWQPLYLRIPLAGFHQMQNAATVFAVLTKIKSIYTKINLGEMINGLADAFWPCRFERLSDKPLVYADGAHNRDSAEKLAAMIDRYLGRKHVICVFGASGDKQCQEMIEALAPHVSEFIVTRSVHPRAADPAELRHCVWQSGRDCRLTETLEDALGLIQADNDENYCYIVAGSLFVAAGMRELFMKENSKIPYFASMEKA